MSHYGRQGSLKYQIDAPGLCTQGKNLRLTDAVELGRRSLVSSLIWLTLQQQTGSEQSLCILEKNVVCKKGVLEGGGPWPNLSVDLLHSQLFLCQKFLRLCAGDLAKLTGEPLTFSAWQAVQNERSFYREIRCFFSLFLCLSIFLSLFMNIFFLNQLLNAK